ncbi:MAG: F0F1 ATP synthase subunit B [Clostridiales bacterium]|nr:F0F1 ATP synthase subunit B [Clostridiales bacterium]
MAKILEKLGLGGWEILFHAVNLILLVVALYFLLYKPVKKIIAGHRKKLNEIYEENKRMQEEKETLENEFEEMKQRAVEESAQIGERALKRSQEIVEDAQKKADAIIESAQKEAIAEKQRMQYELHDTVGHIAVEIAEKILEREVNEKDNRRIIDESLAEWEK